MINGDSIRQTSLEIEPYRYAVIKDFLNHSTIEKLLNHFPKENYYRSSRNYGSDKTYNVVNNTLLKLGEKKYNPESNLTFPWIQLVEELQGEKYIKELSFLLQENLQSCYQEITLKKYGVNDFISAHTDKSDVVATHMLFLNEVWDEGWGGQLCIMKNTEEIITKVLPLYLNSVAFVRSNNSWHSVEKITEPKAERVAIQVAFWRTKDRKVLSGRFDETL